MTKHELENITQAALLLGKDGSAGEADAIINYCTALFTVTDETVRKNILERIGDELNHLLGNTLDAINLAGFKISSDGLTDILNGFAAASDVREDVDNDDQNAIPSLQPNSSVDL